MVDTIGSGIKRMYCYQQARRFPMPVYDFSDDRVKLTIYGKVLDDKYFKVLCYHPELSLVDMEVLTKAQFGDILSEEENVLLTEVGFVKGAYANPSAKMDGVSKLTDRQVDVLSAIRRNVNMTIDDLAEALRMGRRSVEREIAVLRNAGYVAKSGRDNRSPWVVLKEYGKEMGQKEG